MFNGEVRRSAELTRILALPRRDIDGPQYDDAFVEEMSALCRRDGSTAKLKKIQAIALFELSEFGGLFGPIPTGHGKTLITLLAPFILDAKCPLLVLPASLQSKTVREFKKYAKDWHVVLPTMVSYEALGRVNYSTFLERTEWDLVMCDEVHKLKNRKAAVTRRFARLMKGRS